MATIERGWTLFGKLRNARIWLPGLVLHRLRAVAAGRPAGPVHVFFCICDHFEPLWNNADSKTGMRRVRDWLERLPAIVAGHRDAEGNPPRYTFFFPVEEYREEYLDGLAELCRLGIAEVEVHLHHDRDNAVNLRRTLLGFKELLSVRHGLLSSDHGTGCVKYGFIHGNWALDNSRYRQAYCGVNNELQVLNETGCYADFTLPSAPSEAQTSTVNSIYYAVDDPTRPKSHNRGRRVRAGERGRGDLLIVQGPLVLNWTNRKFGLLPRIESGELSDENPPTIERLRNWVTAGVHVDGKADWVFVKTYTHGCQDGYLERLLGGDLDVVFSGLEEHFNDGRRYVLHYVSAREVYNLVVALQEHSNLTSPDIPKHRDYRLVATRRNGGRCR